MSPHHHHASKLSDGFVCVDASSGQGDPASSLAAGRFQQSAHLKSVILGTVHCQGHGSRLSAVLRLQGHVRVTLMGPSTNLVEDKTKHPSPNAFSSRLCHHWNLPLIHQWRCLSLRSLQGHIAWEWGGGFLSQSSQGKKDYSTQSTCMPPFLNVLVFACSFLRSCHWAWLWQVDRKERK